MQLPISPAESVVGQLLIFTASANLDSGVERSGVFGPLIWGSSFERSIVITSSYRAFSSAQSKLRNDSMDAIVWACSAMADRFVASRYGMCRVENGKSEVVAPTSALFKLLVCFPHTGLDIHTPYYIS